MARPHPGLDPAGLSMCGGGVPGDGFADCPACPDRPACVTEYDRRGLRALVDRAPALTGDARRRIARMLTGGVAGSRNEAGTGRSS